MPVSTTHRYVCQDCGKARAQPTACCERCHSHATLDRQDELDRMWLVGQRHMLVHRRVRLATFALVAGAGAGFILFQVFMTGLKVAMVSG